MAQIKPLGGRSTYTSTCTEIKIHPIAKPFEMGAYLSFIKRSIFCLTIRWLKTEILDIFEKSLTHFELLGPQNWSKNFLKKIEKIEKIMKHFFLYFVCIMFYLLYYVPQTWYNTRKFLFTSLNRNFFQIRKTL